MNVAHKTKVSGTIYEVTGGRTRVSGANYDISGGRTRVSGTNYGISFGMTFIVSYRGTDDYVFTVPEGVFFNELLDGNAVGYCESRPDTYMELIASGTRLNYRLTDTVAGHAYSGNVFTESSMAFSVTINDNPIAGWSYYAKSFGTT